MEVKLSSPENYSLRKHTINLKTDRSDGLLLQVHHTYSNFERENESFRFISASFNSQGSHLAVFDHKGHIFIINLEAERYWQLPHIGLPTVISFPILKKEDLLVGLNDNSVVFIHIETGDVTGVLHGHSVPATGVSYSDDGHYYLTSCNAEAIVWDSSTNTQIHKLSLKLEVYLKKVVFMPVTNHILACFQDDTMHIWKFGSFECIKQIVPETWRAHPLNSIAITKNGRSMVIGGQSSSVVIFCLDTWNIRKIIDFPENVLGVKQLEFLSQVFDGGANKILVVLTTLLELFFFDTEALVFLNWMQQISGLTAQFALSFNGKYIATILTTGEINIYAVEKVLWRKKDGINLEESPITRNHSSSSKRTQKTYESLSSIQKEIKTVLDVTKLLPILRQFGEYPQSYRILIWKTILKLPENQEAFVCLSLKKCHPSYNKLESKYPLTNKSLCNSFKKLLSNLSHWCPLFGEVDFLPEFVFPFVKLFHSNPLICFEAVATIIVNWCQNWFEFYPFPPINLLSLLESILGHQDPTLLEFYIVNNVTSSIFVCPLFHTAFSEVLTKADWLKLWDHILSNEPSFLFMAIIAYNVVCQNAIKCLQGTAEIEKFFHTQSAVDLKMVISKAYTYLKKTPDDIHTRQFFTSFQPLGNKGSYIPFQAYPKLIIDSNVEKLQSMRKEEEKLLDEQFKALSIRKELEEKLTQDNTLDDREQIYRELEEKIRKAVDEEEDRLLTERQKLQNLRQELKLKELQVLENTRDKVLKEKIKRKEIEFERLLKDISKRKHREKVEIDTMEKEIKNYYSDLLLRKRQLELQLGVSSSESDVDENLNVQKRKLKDKLTELQDEWDSSYHNQRIDVFNKISAIKGLICDVETQIAKQKVENNFQKQIKDDQAFLEELKGKVNSLEDEVKMLLNENLSNLRSKKEQLKSKDSDFKEPQLRKANKKPSNANQIIKKNGISKLETTRKQIKKKISSGNKNNSNNKIKLKNSDNEKPDPVSLREDSNSFINVKISKLNPPHEIPHQKSKFTQPNKLRHFVSDIPKFSEASG